MEAIEVFSNSMLIVNQVTRMFQAKVEQMAKYLAKVRSLLDQFRIHIVTQDTSVQDCRGRCIGLASIRY